MFGLPAEDWQNLLLSVNVHRKSRRLTPVQSGELLGRALEKTDIDHLCQALGFSDSSTLRKIERLRTLPPDLAATVEWGDRKGVLSMSTAAELMRLTDADAVRESIAAAIEYEITRDEARQVVQIRERSGKSIRDCFQQALTTRPRIEKSELILGSFVDEEAKKTSRELGNEAIERRLKNLLAQTFRDVVVRALRIKGERFSLLLSIEDSQKLRAALNGESVERVVNRLATEINGKG